MDGLPPQLSLPLITGLGLIDSINPCVIGVLILLLTVLLKSGNKRAVLANGIAYTAGVYLTYLVGGLTLLGVFNAIRSVLFISQILYGVIGALVLAAGFLEVKDYFWYGRWFSLAIPKRFIGIMETKASGAHASLWASFSFGSILTLIELPCTGAPYLAILTLMSQSGYAYLSALPLLLYYNLVFVVPLLVIIGLAYRGFSLKRLEGWRQEHKGFMRLAIGLVLLAIGIWIVTAVADYLLWPLVLGTLAVIGAMAFAKYVLKFE
jgi:cytochrome c biogenesis protein CcdA